MIKAEIVAHSLNKQGDELISLLCTFPRIILAEVNTHRMLSKNTSSSRAIPFNKMVEAVENNPFIPIAWQKTHKGMQGTEYSTDKDNIKRNIHYWIKTKNQALENALSLNSLGVTKQLCNRLLEPFMWTTMLITGSKEGWDNFFELRCPKYEISLIPDDSEVAIGKSWKELMEWSGTNGIWAGDLDTGDTIERLSWNKGQAEIHMMALAECIYDAMNESTPRQLKAGEWHIPFRDQIYVGDTTSNKSPLELLSIKINNTSMAYSEDMELLAVKISTAMAARTSYTVVGNEKEINYQKMINLHDRLLSQDPPHSSPLEHCAKCMTNVEYNSFIKGEILHQNVENTSFKNKGWCNNFKGFIPYRYIIDNKYSFI